ncbi:hypothetical protein CN540_29325 [Bacillus toyonensis]|uniref:hypothetical protein n=1 Tax=Bacillus cereus group TaxID=86661 RepID=UPI000BEFA36D|nr:MULTISPECIES: hypothetical protein [Bacillus cereus group]PEL51704.1 hypothetical protein CN633_31095 [Bacillus toyonensis]PEN46032.1 hypothetical protein CN540_29325 [Bacillus toyonensis]PGE05983.1 hypothetical protein COM54_29295 [Bacillus toyonensis]PGE08595.1 hypothetical protein COM64_30960 [Bacillus toyonensis]PRT14262.1 hypothetical protein C6360_29385 [Bacillus wiedmannii]
MSTIRRQVTMDQETEDYINDYMEEHGIRYTGEAMGRICKEHEAAKNTEWSLNYVTEVVSKNLHDVLKSELTKIRLGANSADRNTQILIELLNGYFFLEGVDSLITTDKQEMGSVKIAKEVVAERISNARQKRIDHEAAKNNVT